MNEDPNIKPVRELLQNISKNVETFDSAPRGFINPKLVDRITFFVTVVGVFIIAITFIGMIWDAISQGFGFRFASSVGILLLTLIALRAINTQFE